MFTPDGTATEIWIVPADSERAPYRQSPQNPEPGPGDSLMAMSFGCTQEEAQNAADAVRQALGE